MKKKYSKNCYKIIINTSKSMLRIRCCYPKENPPDIIEIITDTMAYVEFFDGLKKK